MALFKKVPHPSSFSAATMNLFCAGQRPMMLILHDSLNCLCSFPESRRGIWF